MKRPVLLIIANIAILLAVFGSFAHSLLSAPSKESTEETTYLSPAPSQDSEFEIQPDGQPSDNIPLANTPSGVVMPSMTINVLPGDVAGSVVIRGRTEAGNTVTIDNVPVGVLGDGSFSMVLQNCRSSCTVKARNRYGITSQVVNLLGQNMTQNVSTAPVPYGMP